MTFWGWRVLVLVSQYHFSFNRIVLCRVWHTVSVLIRYLILAVEADLFQSMACTKLLQVVCDPNFSYWWVQCCIWVLLVVLLLLYYRNLFAAFVLSIHLSTFCYYCLCRRHNTRLFLPRCISENFMDWSSENP